MDTRRLAVRAVVKDSGIAVGMAAGSLLAGLSSEQSQATTFAPLGYALLVAGGLALTARRGWPAPVLVLSGLCAAGYAATGFEVPAVAYLFAAYTAVRAGHRMLTVVASAALLAVLPLAGVVAGSQDAGGAFAQSREVLPLAWLVAAAAAGEAVRQAERRADEAERTREETARRRADEERLHIARELHDALTHQISIIKVQSEAAVHVARKRGEQVPESLLAIQEAGREATRELRATLDALRDDPTPPRGLDHVADLVERASTAGITATLTIDGQRADVPASVSRTAYRIIQESLTNIARHAAAATASVRIDYQPAVLAIQVDDDGTTTPETAPTPAVGLLGMRERVTALGGHLRAEPRNAGGFSIRAELPLDQTS